MSMICCVINLLVSSNTIELGDKWLTSEIEVTRRNYLS